MLKELRRVKGITRAQLAKELGVSERRIIRWEKEGLGNASFKYVVKMTEVLGVQLETFNKLTNQQLNQN